MANTWAVRTEVKPPRCRRFLRRTDTTGNVRPVAAPGPQMGRCHAVEVAGAGLPAAVGTGPASQQTLQVYTHFSALLL